MVLADPARVRASPQVTRLLVDARLLKLEFVEWLVFAQVWAA